MSFITELKRRNVIRMALLYVVASWLLLQVADVVFDPLGVPDWGFRLVIGMLALGFPLALIFAWIFELTPEGIKRESEIDRAQSMTAGTGQRMNIVIVLLLVLAIVAVVADRLLPESGDPAVAPASETAEVTEVEQTSESENSIAVLPFVNMSGDPENEYFSDGLTEELLNALVRVGELKVTGRTSSFAFKGQNQDLREIGRQLNVANVLEGSVRKAGNRVRITAQLIKASDGYHLWSDTFDRELDDIFVIQEEIASQVTSALHVTLLGESDSAAGAKALPGQINPEAYEEYLRGMYIWQRQPDDLDSLNRARGHFERAMKLDEAYVEPLWGLFLYWDRMNRNGYVEFVDSLAQMAQYAARLNKLAPDSERALNATARSALINFDNATASQVIERAVELYPASSDAVSAYATMLRLQGKIDEAEIAIHKALSLDPLSLEVMRRKAILDYFMHDCESLAQLMERALEIEPDAGRFRGLLAMCLAASGGDLERALELALDEPLAFMRETAQAIIYHHLGDTEKAQERLDVMFRDYDDSASYQYGQIYAQWGDKELALTWLNHAQEIRDAGLGMARSDPMMDPLRDDPRFIELIDSLTRF